MNNANERKLSRYISLILRHKPETIGITLDRNGWADVEKLIDGIKKSGYYIDKDILETIVRQDEKQRYSFNEKHTRIKANQGHSINVDLGLEERKPPEILYHGTATKSIESIMKEGITRQTRQYVHLSTDCETALKVGRRHGKPVILEVNSEAMFNDGCRFYLSDNGVWLTDTVPVKYIKVIG